MNPSPRARLQIFPKSLNLIQEEVQVAVLHLGRKDDHAEKIDSGIQRLITHHHGATFHHAFLDERRHLVNKSCLYIIIIMIKAALQFFMLKTYSL